MKSLTQCCYQSLITAVFWLGCPDDSVNGFSTTQFHIRIHSRPSNDLVLQYKNDATAILSEQVLAQKVANPDEYQKLGQNEAPTYLEQTNPIHQRNRPFPQAERHKRSTTEPPFFATFSPVTATSIPKDKPLVSNQAKTARLMPYWPTITTFTLVNGWDDQKTLDLKEAVNKIIQRNPVLTGRATISGRLLSPSVTIYPGAFLPETHDFVREITVNETTQNNFPNLKAANNSQLLHFMDEFLAPLVSPAECVLESIKHQNPLFGIDIIRLPGGYACYVVRLSHCLGDGVTYYYLMNELNHYFNHKNEPLVPIDWSHPAIAAHELWPKRLSSCDVQKCYGLPAILGLCRNSISIDKHKKRYIILDKQKVKAKQLEFNQQSNKDVNGQHVSANDIISAALCEANKSTDIFAFTIDIRPRGHHFGFNYHNEVPFSKLAARDPVAFRKILKQGYYFESNRLPLWPFVLGRVGRISSLASIQKLISSEDVHVLCHSVLGSFVQNIPMDVAFIISMNKNSYVVLHNFKNFEMKGLLKDICIENDDV